MDNSAQTNQTQQRLTPKEEQILKAVAHFKNAATIAENLKGLENMFLASLQGEYADDPVDRNDLCQDYMRIRRLFESL